MRELVVVMGTRPEVIKMAPLAIKLRKNENFKISLVSSGQHKDLFNDANSAFDLLIDHQMDVMVPNQGVDQLFIRSMQQFTNYLSDKKVDAVLVHGDTSTSAACALAAFNLGVSVIHIEAGLRSGTLESPWPEEANRRIIDSIAELAFAPTQIALENLRRESMAKHSFLVGNTVVDALHFAIKKSRTSDFSHLEGLNLDEPFVLVTLHRRENVGHNFSEILGAIRNLARQGIRFVIPVHLNPKVRAQIHRELDSEENILLINPLKYLDFVYLLEKCKLVLTDSGGVQEEGITLSKPILIARNETERTEGIIAGGAVLVGSDSKAIENEIKKLYEDAKHYFNMSSAKNPYGDGTSASQIILQIENWFKSEDGGL
jgi:UDP-N-acetylglucosamine 2-epimerase (non-hydrolysing)